MPDQPMPTAGKTSMDRQPMPVEGVIDVTPRVRERFNNDLTERERRGIETYGRSLQSHNGRDAGQDAWEELIDLAQYLEQLRIEHADALVEIGDLSSRLERLTARLAAVERERDEWGGKAASAAAEASAFRRQHVDWTAKATMLTDVDPNRDPVVLRRLDLTMSCATCLAPVRWDGVLADDAEIWERRFRPGRHECIQPLVSPDQLTISLPCRPFDVGPTP